MVKIFVRIPMLGSSTIPRRRGWAIDVFVESFAHKSCSHCRTFKRKPAMPL